MKYDKNTTSFSGIYKLPICPQCKDTKYVGSESNLAIHSTYQICSRCSIMWNGYGRIEPYSMMTIDGKPCVTVLKKKIQQEAEKLWIEAGKPDGRSEEFWFAAEKNVL